MVRSLVFASQNFGMAPPGAYRSALPGTEEMDGTIFIRVSLSLDTFRVLGNLMSEYCPVTACRALTQVYGLGTLRGTGW